VDPKQVECDHHGLKPAAYVCDHVFRERQQGFVASTEEPDNPFPDAWCLACEQVRAAHGGWNEAAEQHLRVRLVCSDCYLMLRDRNR
jgi:hypothetical protein